MLVDEHGIPLSLAVSGANRHDSAVLDTLLSRRVTPSEMGVKGEIVENLCLDAGYEGKAGIVETHGMVTYIRSRSGESAARSRGFKPWRWIVEVAHSRPNRFRKLHTR